ncbi:MAG: response regulator [bacterium]|nr:response regulator [bacterium]
MDNKKKILIIEDNKEICDLIEMILSDRYEIAAYTEISSIPQSSDLNEFDLIICDFLIGSENAGVVIESFPLKKYLIVTALSVHHPQLQRLAERDNVSYLQKPFDVAELIKIVESIVG